MEDNEIAFLQNLILKYSPKEILNQLSQAFFRLSEAQKEEAAGDRNGLAFSRSVGARTAWQDISHFVLAKFRDNEPI